jgi:hypothetical protein
VSPLTYGRRKCTSSLSAARHKTRLGLAQESSGRIRRLLAPRTPEGAAWLTEDRILLNNESSLLDALERIERVLAHDPKIAAMGWCDQAFDR